MADEIKISDELTASPGDISEAETSGWRVSRGKTEVGFLCLTDDDGYVFGTTGARAFLDNEMLGLASFMIDLNRKHRESKP